MKNRFFDITFDAKSGGIIGIANPCDDRKMNWCAANSIWGLVRTYNRYFTWKDGRKTAEDAPVLEHFSEFDDRALSVYSNGMVRISVERYFKENGNFCERYTAENLRDTDVFIGQDNFGIVTPFNDRYTSSAECMVRHCNAHVWCGHNTAYVNALRMGESDLNLGLILTKGAIDSYSIENCDSNVRGDIVLNSGFFDLTVGEKQIIEWEMFWHSGNDDFYRQALDFPQMIRIDAENFTLFKGEVCEFYAESMLDLSEAVVTCAGSRIDSSCDGKRLHVSYAPEKTGEYRFDITVGNISTYAEFIVVNSLEETVEKRLGFIVDRQQYLKRSSPLYGAFLIYDNKEKHAVFDNAFGDHNACHERIGMALLLVKYLQTHTNEKLRKALDLYIEFVKREFYDEETGDVFTTIGKKKGHVRLYNAPWVMMLFSEMYLLTKDTYYTDNIVRIIRKYYENGGGRFYPNGLKFTKIAQVLKVSGNPDYDEVLSLMTNHVENIISIGTNYPPHEVTYEQTIVTPAVTLISDMGAITGNKRYVSEAKKHIVNLERFNGHQPSYHLYEIPIRYWDDYWFGKSALFGDVFPHYWSCLTSRSFIDYYQISGEERYKTMAEKCLRNCLCLYDDEGGGSCAYVYPYMSNGVKGQFYDEWANDQDFALYIALCENMI